MVAERAKNCWRLEQAGLSCAMDSNANRRLENEILALWLAPIVSTLPLIPFFTLRFSPLFLGTLMADRGPIRYGPGSDLSCRRRELSSTERFWDMRRCSLLVYRFI